ncbi:Zinc finger, RING-type [Sesbania bispinosa]|nr:Zinc finger, RING-type [Sesbania bispinosa]
MAQRSEEIRFSIMNTDSAAHDRIAGDHHHNDTAIPLPVASVSPFPHWNINETPQYYSNEPAGDNSMIGSSQFKSSQNFQMDRIYSYEGEHNSLPFRLAVSGFPYPEGYIGWPYQHTRHDNLTIPDRVTNTAFNVNSFEKPDSGGKCLTPSDSSANRLQMVNPSGTAVSGNIGQPLLNMNLGMMPFNPNQGIAGPLITPGRTLDERFMTIGSGSNKESKSTTIVPKVNVTGNPERVFLPPANTYHNQMGSRSFFNSSLDTNSAFSGFQNNSGVVSDLVHVGNREVSFDSRPGLHLGPSHAFQRPASGDQNHYLRQVNRDLGLGGVKDTGMEFAGVSHKNSFQRCTVLPSFPFAGSQTMPCDNNRQSRVNGQLVPSSTGMVTDQSLFEPLPENNGTLTSQSFPSPALVAATRSTRGKDPSSNHGQSQVGDLIQQSNSLFGRHSASDQGIRAGKGNMTAQVSRPSIIPSLKRPASQPLASTVQDQRRKTLPTQPFIHHPSIPTSTRMAPSVPNTPLGIPPLVHAAPYQSPQTIQSFTPPLFPPAWTKSSVSAPNTTQTIPSLMHTASYVPPIDKRISSFYPSSHPPPLPNQQLLTQSLPNQQLLAQSLARQRLRSPIVPTAPNIALNYIKCKGQTPEPIGYKCLLCKRDLSFEPEGPISQPSVPPAVAVLSCGHTFHEYCLERITPDDQYKDPPCIPCALGE